MNAQQFAQRPQQYGYTQYYPVAETPPFDPTVMMPMIMTIMMMGIMMSMLKPLMSGLS